MPTVIKPKRSETASSVPAANSLAIGELAMNVTDGKFYTKTSGGVVKEVGGAGAVTLQAVTTSGAVSTNDITLNGADLITDEILLSLPMAPTHDFDCGIKLGKEDKVKEIREHPFDVLKNIKIADFGKE